MYDVLGGVQTRASRVTWLLEELGVDWTFTHVDLRTGQHRSPAFLALNPLGRVPVVMVEGAPVAESGAICMVLASRHPGSGLLAAPGTLAHARQVQWSVFATDELEQPLWTRAKHSFALPEALRVPAVKDTAAWEWQRAADALALGLGDRPYLVDDAFSVADLLAAHTLRWAAAAKLPTGHATLDAYAARCLERPAFQRSLDKAAASTRRFGEA